MDDLFHPQSLDNAWPTMFRNLSPQKGKQQNLFTFKCSPVGPSACFWIHAHHGHPCLWWNRIFHCAPFYSLCQGRKFSFILKYITFCPFRKHGWKKFQSVFWFIRYPNSSVHPLKFIIKLIIETITIQVGCLSMFILHFPKPVIYISLLSFLISDLSDQFK